MAIDRPDWQIGADIEAQTIESLAIDIATQTVAKLDIDIIAQSIEKLNTDIVAQSVGNLAIDVVAQTLAQLKIDIDAQSLAALNVDIIAQTLAQLNVDITAQTLANLNVDIIAQTIGELTINIINQAVGIYLQPEWAAKTGVDKDFDALATNQPWHGSASGSYTVPAGKTLYITDCSFFINPRYRYDASKPLYFFGYLYNGTTGAYFARLSGIGGAVKVFTKPGVIPAGEDFEYIIYNASLVQTTIAVHANGFEV